MLLLQIRGMFLCSLYRWQGRIYLKTKTILVPILQHITKHWVETIFPQIWQETLCSSTTTTKTSVSQSMSITVWCMNIIHYPWKNSTISTTMVPSNTQPPISSHCAFQAFLNLRNDNKNKGFLSRVKSLCGCSRTWWSCRWPSRRRWKWGTPEESRPWR